jgi:hypothetical protein
MIYIRSLLAGLFALVGLAILLFVGLQVYISVFVPAAVGAWAFGGGWWLPVLALVMILTFVGGFVWEFRRVGRRRLSPR